MYYYHRDDIGSIDGISDSSGDIVVEYEYDSYGRVWVDSGSELVPYLEYLDSIESSGVLGVFSEGGRYFNSRLYTSREYDSQIDIYYMRARYYDPSIGRFISRDPIDIEDDINLYSYVGNNPVVWVDLMGTDRGVIREKGNILSGILMIGFGIEAIHAPDKDYIPTETYYDGWQKATIYSAGIIGPVKGGAAKNIGKEVKDLGEKGVKNGLDKIKNSLLSSKVGGVGGNNKNLKDIASDLGYKEVKGQYSHGQKIYYNPKAKKYISKDIDEHNGGTWKMADSIKDLGKKETRLGTFDINLNKIGD